MFVIPLHSGTSVSATTGLAWSQLDIAKIGQKYFDQRNLALELQITSGGSLAIRTAVHSTQSGNTCLITNASGTSILTTGTSVGGPGDNGRYWLPLFTSITGSGSTEHLTLLKGVPYITFDYRAQTNNVSFVANLITG